MRAVLPLLLLCGALAACDGAPKQAAGNSATALPPGAPDPDKVITERWQKLFGDPAAVVAAINEFGFKSSPLAKAGDGYKAAGIEQTFPEWAGPVVIKARYEATSAAPDRVDAVTFTFDIARKGELITKRDRDALKTPLRIVAGFLNRFEVYPSDEIKSAINTYTSVTKDQYIAHITVVSKKLSDAKDDKRDLVTVTITNAGTAPAQPTDKPARK